MSISSYIFSCACSPSPLKQHQLQQPQCCSRSSKVVRNATFGVEDGLRFSGNSNTLASECRCSNRRSQILCARYWHHHMLQARCCLKSPAPSIATSPCFAVADLELKGEDNVATSKKCIEVDPEVLIECRNVYKSFGEKQILKGTSLKIRHGEAVGIIGPSGTGKSTILRIMAGLLVADKFRAKSSFVARREKASLAMKNGQGFT